MKNTETAILVANFYEHHRQDNPSEVKYYLKKNGFGWTEASLIAAQIREEIAAIQDIQDEQAYNDHIDRKDSGTPSRVEVIVSLDMIQKVIKSKNSSDIQKTIDNISIISTVAYKYQLKYALLILDIMLTDDVVWEPVVMH